MPFDCAQDRLIGTLHYVIREFGLYGMVTLTTNVIFPLLQSEFAMRPDTHQLQSLIVGLLVNQYEVWVDVAVTKGLPLAGQRMITVSFCQWFIAGQLGNNVQHVLQLVPPGTTDPLQIGLEPGLLKNFPHALCHSSAS